MSMLPLDKYSLKARLYPTLLVLLPAYVVATYYISGFEGYYQYVTALLGAGLLTYVLAQAGRDSGKRKEPELYAHWGGKPTTQILRHSNPHLDHVTKSRYHQLLTKHMNNLQLPTPDEERNNAAHADGVYDGCARFVIGKTRDEKQFGLLLAENTNYGFRRNLWGMKPWALAILIGCLLLHLYLATHYFTAFNQTGPTDIFLVAFLVAAVFYWIFQVTREWVRLPAFAYAERLYESLNSF